MPAQTRSRARRYSSPPTSRALPPAQPWRPTAGSARNRISFCPVENNLAIDDRHGRNGIAQDGEIACEWILREHYQVRELARFERALARFVEGQIGASEGRTTQGLSAREALHVRHRRVARAIDARRHLPDRMPERDRNVIGRERDRHAGIDETTQRYHVILTRRPDAVAQRSAPLVDVRVAMGRDDE